MAFECAFDLLKDGDQRVYGVQLVARPHSQSEEFVAAMATALKRNTHEADITYRKGYVYFQLNSEVHREPVPREDRELVEDLFQDPEATWQYKPAGSLTPGFCRVAVNRIKGQH